VPNSPPSKNFLKRQVRQCFAFFLWKKRAWGHLPKKAKQLIIFAFVGGFLLHSAVLYLKEHRQHEAVQETTSKDRVFSVGAETAIIQDLKNIFSTQAYLQSWKEVVVRPSQTAIVKKVNVQVGQFVKSGDVLAYLSSELQQLKAELDKIDLQLRNMDFAVTLALARKNFVSEKEFKQRKLEFRAQEIRAKIAKMENTDILDAPISGVVSEISMKNGDYVDQPNQYYIKISDTSEMKLAIYIPQSVATKLAKGAEVELTRNEADASGVQRIQTSKASIDAVAPVVDPKTGSILVEMRTHNTPKSWVPGMYVEVNMTIDQSPKALVVPQQAVIFENNQAFVYRVVSEQADHRAPATAAAATELATQASVAPTDVQDQAQPQIQKVQKVAVKLGLRDAKRIEIKEGLEQFDLIVTKGQGALADGSKVDIVQ